VNVSVKIEGIELFGNLAKQVPFALAKTLTKTAQAGQSEVINTLGEKFQLRTNWYKPSNQIGIRITSAKKNNLVAEVKTNAGFLKLHEAGQTKFPFGKYLAIPTQNVRRTKRDLIPKNQRPGNLQNSFVVASKQGGTKILFVRKGKGKRAKAVPMYILELKAKIKQVSVFYGPVERAVRANLQKNFDEAFGQAVRTAK
jgi:hypothetical protein